MFATQPISKNTRIVTYDGEKITNRESQSLDKYLQEIGKVSLVSIDEEVELAQRIREGDQMALEKLTKANLRFVGPETMESRIFSRLTAWQNWIFIRPNASGPEGALRRYGSGQRANFDRKRV